MGIKQNKKLNFITPPYLRKNNFITENYASTNEEAIMVFTDIIKMYPSTDATQAVHKTGGEV